MTELGTARNLVHSGVRLVFRILGVECGEQSDAFGMDSFPTSMRMDMCLEYLAKKAGPCRHILFVFLDLVQ